MRKFHRPRFVLSLFELRKQHHCYAPKQTKLRNRLTERLSFSSPKSPTHFTGSTTGKVGTKRAPALRNQNQQGHRLLTSDRMKNFLSRLKNLRPEARLTNLTKIAKTVSVKIQQGKVSQREKIEEVENLAKISNVQTLTNTEKRNKSNQEQSGT